MTKPSLNKKEAKNFLELMNRSHPELLSDVMLKIYTEHGWDTIEPYVDKINPFKYVPISDNASCLLEKIFQEEDEEKWNRLTKKETENDQKKFNVQLWGGFKNETQVFSWILNGLKNKADKNNASEEWCFKHFKQLIQFEDDPINTSYKSASTSMNRDLEALMRIVLEKELNHWWPWIRKWMEKCELKNCEVPWKLLKPQEVQRSWSFDVNVNALNKRSLEVFCILNQENLFFKDNPSEELFKRISKEWKIIKNEDKEIIKEWLKEYWKADRLRVQKEGWSKDQERELKEWRETMSRLIQFEQTEGQEKNQLKWLEAYWEEKLPWFSEEIGWNIIIPNWSRNLKYGMHSEREKKNQAKWDEVLAEAIDQVALYEKVEDWEKTRVISAVWDGAPHFKSLKIDFLSACVALGFFKSAQKLIDLGIDISWCVKMEKELMECKMNPDQQEYKKSFLEALHLKKITKKRKNAVPVPVKSIKRL